MIRQWRAKPRTVPVFSDGALLNPNAPIVDSSELRG